MKPKVASSIAQLAVGLTLALGFAESTQAAEVTLKVHHFLSAKAPVHTKFLQPWARRVEAASRGRLKFRIHPKMSLGGTPPDLLQQVRDGKVDIVWTLSGYTPGYFPRTEVFELPTVHRGSARATNLAIQDNFRLIAEDFTDLHPILVHVHAGNALHLRDREVRTIEDLAGLRLRTPSRTGAWLIAAWGAEPVGMPVPTLPQALSNGSVDGALVPFEIVHPLRLYELTRYSIEGPDQSRFGTSVLLLLMNKNRYTSLPKSLKLMLDANSGAALAAETGLIWDLVESPGRIGQQRSGGEIVALSAEVKADFDRLGEGVVERWIAEAEQKGIDGRRLVDAARNSIEIHSQR